MKFALKCLVQIAASLASLASRGSAGRAQLKKSSSYQIKPSRFGFSEKSTEFLGRETYIGRTEFGRASHHNGIVMHRYLNAFTVLAKT
jgi:hypothetical protein